MSDSSPIWLLSAPFSGNAWVAGCLHQHPQLFALPQLDLLLADTVGDALKVFEIGQGTHGQGLSRAVAYLIFERQDNYGISQAQAWLNQRAAWPCGQLLDYLTQAAAPQRLVIPDDDAALRPLALKRIRRFNPSPTIVHLTRHPWSQGILLHHWAREHIHIPIDYKDHSFTPPQIEPQLPWYAANNNLLTWRKQLPAAGYLRLSSEQVESADATLWPRVCEQLNISSNAAIHQAMHDPRDWPFAQPGPTAAPAGLDAEARTQFSDETLALADQCRMDAPLPWRADGQGFDAVVREMALQLGYAQSA